MSNIISFKARNFKSYKDEVEISFRALNSEFRSENYHEVEISNGERIRLLNSAVIYGANASGKSNIIWAMFALFSFIRSSRECDPDSLLPYEPFLFSSETEKAPIQMMVEFVANAEIYTYTISYTDERFVEENLFCSSKNKKLFTRNNDDVSFFEELLEFKEKKFLKNHLVLSKLALEANPLIQSVYEGLSASQTIPVGNDSNFTRIKTKSNNRR